MTKKKALYHILGNQIEKLGYIETSFFYECYLEDLEACISLCFVTKKKVYKEHVLTCQCLLELLIKNNADCKYTAEKMLTELNEKLKPFKFKGE